MSSSSSSEYDCGESCYYAYSPDYGRNVDYGRTPFYPTMGQPLVYYTEVQPPPMRRQRSRESGKRNPNCFVKAFRWYTKELGPTVPQRCSQDFNRNMNGFATWLDSKYDEFLREGFLKKSMVHLKFKQTSEFEAHAIPQNEESKLRTTKKIGKMRSPWKKKRRQRSEESGDTIGKSNKSFEYILRPKDLCPPASESCHVSPTTNYNPSNATIIKTSNKSQSLTNVRQEKNIIIKESPDVIVVHEGSKIRKGKEQQKVDVKPIDASKLRDSTVILGLRPIDTACQCPVESVMNTDAGTQYDNKDLVPVETKRKYPSETKDHKEYFYDSCVCSKENVMSVDANSQYQKQNNDESQNIRTHKTEYQKAATQTCPTKTVKGTYCNLKEQDSLTRKPQKVFINDEVQTSDCSIRLEKNTVCYPLFMKIVCADKLNDGCKAGLSN